MSASFIAGCFTGAAALLLASGLFVGVLVWRARESGPTEDAAGPR